LRAQPWPQAPFSPLPAAHVGFVQLGWQVQREADAPARVLIRRSDPQVVVLRAIVDPAS
jgi:hypothetical protein